MARDGDVLKVGHKVVPVHSLEDAPHVRRYGDRAGALNIRPPSFQVEPDRPAAVALAEPPFKRAAQ